MSAPDKVGPDLLRKRMHAALEAGQVRRYFTLRRRWFRTDGFANVETPPNHAAAVIQSRFSQSCKPS